MFLNKWSLEAAEAHLQLLLLLPMSSRLFDVFFILHWIVQSVKHRSAFMSDDGLCGAIF